MSTRRALVCAPLMPEHDRESGSRRIYDLIEFLRDAEWAVSFVAQNGRGGDRYRRMLQQRGVATYTGFETLTDQFIACGRFDLAIFAFWYTAEQYLPTIRAISPMTRVIVDSIDIHFLRNARRTFRPLMENRSAGMLDPDYASEMMREVNTYAGADAVLTVSQKEADLINDLVGDPVLAYNVPDNENLPPAITPFAERKGILFVGNFRHPPNVEALEYLCKDILPRLDPAIMDKHPVYIVGNALTEAVRNYSNELPHVHMVGWVPSVLPYLQQTRISVIPLLYGAGTKRKLIQALMVGTPTVSTTIGTEGLKLRDGEHVLVADTPASFAASMTRLLADEKLWQAIACRGRTHISQLHGREVARTCLMQAASTVLMMPPKQLQLTGSIQNLHSHRLHQQYQQLIHRIQKIVGDTLPVDAKVIVVSKGDDDLLELPGRVGWHFPQIEGSGPENLLSQSSEGSVDVPWIRKGITYEFRLYAASKRAIPLAAVTVTRDDQILSRVAQHAAPQSDRAFITATPKPIPIEGDLGTATISWNTGDNSEGQVYVSIDGLYAGYYPLSSAEAITHLEWLRTKGGEFLIFPRTAFWWLDHYREFKHYLEQHYQLIIYREDTCIIFSLYRSPIIA